MIPVTEPSRIFGSGKAFLSSCLGILADLYFLSSVNLLKDMYSKARADAGGAELTHDEKTTLAAIIFTGTTCGQLIFGYSADILGRKVICITTACLMMAGCLGSALCFGVEGYWSELSMLTFFQFVIGFGIGGEYPLSASLTSENSDPEHSGRKNATVYSMMGFGCLCAPTITWLLLAVGIPEGYAWRISFSLGLLPVIAAFSLRYSMEESARYRAVASMAGTGTIKYLKKYWFYLLGTAISWFLYDVVTYGLSTFTGAITTKLGLGGFGDGIMDETVNTVLISLITAPAYVACLWIVDALRRKNIQLVGFSIMAACYLSIGFMLQANENLPVYISVALLLVGKIGDASGVGLSTYVIPGEYFPTAVRATFHGISAASGKCGAVVGSAAIGYLTHEYDMWVVLMFCGVVSLLGAIWTFVFIPSYTMEDLRRRVSEEAIELDTDISSSSSALPITSSSSDPYQAAGRGLGTTKGKHPAPISVPSAGTPTTAPNSSSVESYNPFEGDETRRQG